MPVSLPVTQAFRSIERKESGIDAARRLMTGRPDEHTWQRQSLTANRRVRYFFTRHTRWLGSAESAVWTT